MKHANAAIFVPHNGCPHQCSFCNQKSITGHCNQPSPEDVVLAAETAMQSLNGKSVPAELAFFGGSFTAIRRDYMVSLLEAAFPYVKNGIFSGIRISTRPDAIDSEVLSLLKKYGVTSIELGAQSMQDRVLELNRRGHTAAHVEQASGIIREAGFFLGLQMMTGLYGDSFQGGLETARRLAALSPDTVRIYPTVVMKGTELASLYRAGRYVPMGLEETVRLCAELLELFEARGIAVIRMGLHSTPQLSQDMLAGPYHPAFGELCKSRLYFNRLLKALKNAGTPKGELTVLVNPADISIALGQKRGNVELFLRAGYQIRFQQALCIPKGESRFFCGQTCIQTKT